MTGAPSEEYLPGMRLAWLGFFAGVLVSATASAQSLEATGPVLAGGEVVGEVRDVVVTPQKWLSPTRLSFALPVGDGNEGVLQGVLDLAAEKSHVIGRVCRPTPLVEEERTSDGFRIELLPAGRAELLSRSRQGAMVRVPAPTARTFGEERLVAERALTKSCKATDAAPPSLTCTPFVLRSRPDETTTTSFEVDAARAVTSEARTDGWYAVAIDDFDGFRWHGFTRTRPACTVPPTNTGQGMPGHAMGVPQRSCWQGEIPRGAVLRSADRKTAVLTAKRSFEARLCLTEHPFEWEVETSSGGGTVVVRGFFDGAPVAVEPSPDH